MAIVAVLVALLTVAVQYSREASRRTSCANNLRQISIAMVTFVDTKKRLPGEPKAGEIGGWPIELLPFLEEKSLFDQLATSPSLSPGNISPLVRNRPAVYTCPSAYEGDSSIAGVPAMHYAMDRYNNMSKNPKGVLRMFGDVAVDCRLPWAAGPRQIELGVRSLYNNPTGEWLKRGPHGSGFNQINSRDQTVEFVEQVIPPGVERLMTLP